LDEIGTEAKLDEIKGQKWKCALRYTYFLLVRSRKNQQIRVPEYTFSLLPCLSPSNLACVSILDFKQVWSLFFKPRRI